MKPKRATFMVVQDPSSLNFGGAGDELIDEVFALFGWKLECTLVLGH
ncbi:hypothetical protein HY641_00125 [Candidatus Woesearchaeota archaeon]|nr:hypothetical protein [Candidatus Woesearchaeota archaeon]